MINIYVIFLERIRTSVDLVNILNVPLLLQNVELIWVHSLASDDTSLDKSTLAETEVFNSILLAPDASTPVSHLHKMPILTKNW